MIRYNWIGSRMNGPLSTTVSVSFKDSRIDDRNLKKMNAFKNLIQTFSYRIFLEKQQQQENAKWQWHKTIKNGQWKREMKRIKLYHNRIKME